MKEPEQKLSHSLLRALNNSRDGYYKLCTPGKSLNNDYLAKKKKIIKDHIPKMGQEEKLLGWVSSAKNICVCGGGTCICVGHRPNRHLKMA